MCQLKKIVLALISYKILCIVQNWYLSLFLVQYKALEFYCLKIFDLYVYAKQTKKHCLLLIIHWFFFQCIVRCFHFAWRTLMPFFLYVRVVKFQKQTYKPKQIIKFATFYVNFHLFVNIFPWSIPVPLPLS